MKPRTEEFLNFLLYSAEMLMRPTFVNLTQGYESWAYGQGLLRQVAALERRQLIERQPGTDDRVYRLTAKGRLHALGGRDPQARWSRKWDQRWRIVLFDVPTARDSERVRLRRYLRDRSFGCLQKSVWITPDPLEEENQTLAGGEVNVRSLALLEARPCGGESDTAIVTAAWDFARINRLYERHLKVLGERPPTIRTEPEARTFRRWAAAERAAWLDAVLKDPLLPQTLLPPGYLGQQAWRRRADVLRAALPQLDTLNHA